MRENPYIFEFEATVEIFTGGPSATFTGLCEAVFFHSFGRYEFGGYKVIKETVLHKGLSFDHAELPEYFWNRLGSAIRERNTTPPSRPTSQYIEIAKIANRGPLIIEVAEAAPGHVATTIETLSM